MLYKMIRWLAPSLAKLEAHLADPVELINKVKPSRIKTHTTTCSLRPVLTYVVVQDHWGPSSTNRRARQVRSCCLTTRIAHMYPDAFSQCALRLSCSAVQTCMAPGSAPGQQCAMRYNWGNSSPRYSPRAVTAEAPTRGRPTERYRRGCCGSTSGEAQCAVPCDGRRVGLGLGSGFGLGGMDAAVRSSSAIARRTRWLQCRAKYARLRAVTCEW